jgi:NADH-quinone oxidoreductase subunit G
VKLMSKVTITIDGKECQVEEGTFILNAARANDIFIPAVCYLTRCSPTLACRICLVEADGKQVYACNAKAKDGMNVVTETETIALERRAIMEVYDVNHPLECGVCDQSGECELQNYTMIEKVDSQSYSIADTNKPVTKWSELINYNAALCIVCERCTTVCKDMVGDAAIKTSPREGSGPIDDAFKADMPKDAYAMWNKLNKSLISPVGGDTLDCTDCGECIAVCPVGAIVSDDFQYKSNAWELTKVPSTCAHCSAGCHINYEKKHTSVENPEERLYRVTNEWNYVSLCGAGRFGFDFENRVDGKDSDAFNSAVEALKKADTITFNSEITNEEAYILQSLKEKLGLKLVNEGDRKFNEFLNAYGSVSGAKLPTSTIKTVHESDFIVSVGSALKTDNPGARRAFNNGMTMNKGAGIYFHPVEDSVIAGMNKGLISINHKVGLEEAALYLILDLFADKEKLPTDVKEYLAGFHSTKTITVEETIKEKVTETVTKMVKDEETGEESEVTEEVTKTVPKKVSKEVEVDDNKLLEIVGAASDFTASLEKALKKKESFVLMVGEDLYTHPKSANLARLSALVEKCSDFNLVIIPPKTNSLGVAMICDLDSEATGYTVGYNVKADFTLSALGNGDLDMPALNQQEGTFTTAYQIVAPLNAALDYKGYVLNDLANAILDENKTYTIDYTPELGNKAGFKSELFDDLPNYYSNDMQEHRGYTLEAVTVQVTDTKLEPIMEAIDGEIIYHANPVLQFNDFTAKSKQIETKGGLFVSSAFAEAKGIANGDSVSVNANSNSLTLAVTIDSKIDGNIAFVSQFDSSIASSTLFNGYRFNQATITKV